MTIFQRKQINYFRPAVMLSIFLLAGFASAYYGEFQIGDEPVNPRISAMGSAGTALDGKGACYYNPASPAFAPAPFLSAEFGRLPGDMSKNLIETAWMFPRWFAGASMRVHSTDFGVTTEQTASPDGVPLSSNQSMQATLTGGFTFGNGRFASGHSVIFFQERIGDNVYRAFTYSPGIVYRLIPDKVTLGASMLNYVRLDTVLDPWYKTPRAWYKGAWGLPRYARAGVSWKDTLERAALPFTLACDLVYSDVYDRFMVPLGAEVWLTPFLAARAGLNVNHPSDKAHFGAGVRWSNIVFDFDYGLTRPVSGAELETKWLFGLTYSLKSIVRQKPAVVTSGPKKSPSASEPKGFAPPKRILLTPKAPDSSQAPVPAGETVPEQRSDSIKAVTPPDSSASGSMKATLENTVTPGSVPAKETEIGSAPADTIPAPDTIKK